MKGLRQLFTKIIEENPYCPKNVVIGSLHWKRLEASAEVDNSKQHAGEGNSKRLEEVGSKRTFTLYAATDDMELVELVTMNNQVSTTVEVMNKRKSVETAMIQSDGTTEDGEPREVEHNNTSKNISQNTSKNGRVKTQGVNSLLYSGSDVLDFVCAVNDENPIHRIAHPIVPGCLLLEGVKAWLEAQNQNPTDIYMRFKLPVYGDDVVELVEEPKGRYNLHGLVRGRTVFVVKWM